MKELTIQQVITIMGWSYPTALDFARKHGRLEESGRPTWMVPDTAIEQELKDEELALARKRRRLAEELVAANGSR